MTRPGAGGHARTPTSVRHTPTFVRRATFLGFLALVGVLSAGVGVWFLTRGQVDHASRTLPWLILVAPLVLYLRSDVLLVDGGLEISSWGSRRRLASPDVVDLRIERANSRRWLTLAQLRDGEVVRVMPLTAYTQFPGRAPPDSLVWRVARAREHLGLPS